jgi:PPOX class probable F420-dependent enzyme
MASMPDTLDHVRHLVTLDSLAVAATTRRDGSIHASVVNAGVLAHPASGRPCVGFVALGGAAKLDHLRRSGRACLTFRHHGDWAAVEGPVQLAGPADTLEGFPAQRLPALLREIFVAAGGTHDDWEEYDRVMAAEGRTAVLIEPARITGNA